MSFPKSQRIENRELLDSFHKMSCLICSRLGCDPCHIRSKGSGGNDVSENLLNLCRFHHSEQHAKGHYYMATKYPAYKRALTVRLWVFDRFKKLTRIEVEDEQ